MLSATISQQLTLDFEPGLVERYRSLLECCASGVYKHGLSRVAIDLNQAPGNLSVQLSGDSSRHFSVESLEAYIEKTGDTTPVYYLIEKFLDKKTAKNDAAQAEVLRQFAALQEAMKKAGLA